MPIICADMHNISSKSLYKHLFTVGEKEEWCWGAKKGIFLALLKPFLFCLNAFYLPV
jgi:hypothetical protein